MFDQISHYKAVRARIVAVRPVLTVAPSAQPTAKPAAPEPQDRRGQMLAGAPGSLRVRAAIFDALEAHGVAWREIFGTRSRSPQLVRVRWSVFKNLHDIGLTTPQIGRLTGYDHTTIIYGLRALAKREAADANG